MEKTIKFYRERLQSGEREFLNGELSEHDYEILVASLDQELSTKIQDLIYGEELNILTKITQGGSGGTEIFISGVPVQNRIKQIKESLK